MNDKELSLLTERELATAIQTLSTKDLQEQMKKIAAHQVGIVIKSLSASKCSEWQEMLPAAIASLRDRNLLEAAGRALNLSQALFLFNNIKLFEEDGKKRMPSLLVGMDHVVFNSLILKATAAELEALKNESCTEPLQHQLMLFAHGQQSEIDTFVSTLRNLEDAIDAIEPQKMSFDMLDAAHAQIGKSMKKAEESLKKLDNALAIAWSSGREDLISSLSFYKECWQKYANLAVGFPQQKEYPATGLYARLDQRLNAIFRDPLEPNDIEALNDDEPAIEALVKFSIWYLYDYWEIGLLPSINSSSGLDLDADKYSDDDRFNYRSELFTKARRELALIGLACVGDLKKEHIYSKEMLLQFIAKKRGH